MNRNLRPSTSPSLMSKCTREMCMPNSEGKSVGSKVTSGRQYRNRLRMHGSDYREGSVWFRA